MFSHVICSYLLGLRLPTQIGTSPDNDTVCAGIILLFLGRGVV